MIFSIFIILLLGIVVFFHFVQGFFSATISAIITVIAAVLAVSYHENVVNLLLKGQMADNAHAMVLCMIFAVVYFVLRLIFDAAVPGNVRCPATLDKVGAIIMGLVAGVFSTGIFAIAAQMLPFDPGIGMMGYSRYKVHDNASVTVPTDRQFIDSHINSEMEDSSMKPEKQLGLLLPVDDWVMNTVYHLSNGGSLSGDRTLNSIHPDYLQELFGQRLGIQTGARRVALQYAGKEVIEVNGVYTLPTAKVEDGETKEMRSSYEPLYKKEIKPTADQRILIVRIRTKGNATDDADRIFRFSCGSIHLVGKVGETYKDYYPIGTYEASIKTVLLNKPDDFLFVKNDNGFDAVFIIDSALLEGGKAANKIRAETFVNVKRMANVDLSGMEVKERISPSPSIQLIRNPILKTRLLIPDVAEDAAAANQSNDAPQQPTAPTPDPIATPTPTPTPVVPETPAGPQTLPGKDLASSIKVQQDTGILAPGFRGLGVSTADATGTDTAVAGGKITFGKTPGAISVATVDPTATLSKLGDGLSTFTQFYCPSDRVMVQVVVHPYTAGWDWVAQIGTTALLDGNGNKYPPNGCYQLAKVGDSQGLLLRYDAEHTNFSIASPDGAAEGDIYYVFLIPHDTELKSLTMASKEQPLDVVTKIP